MQKFATFFDFGKNSFTTSFVDEVADTTPPEITNLTAGPQDGATGDVPLILELAEAGGTADIYTVLFPNGETFPDGPQIIAGDKADNTPAPAAWTSLGQSEGSGLTATYTLVDELDGFFRFGVVAVDEAGNIGPPAYSVPIYINTLTVVPYVQNIVKGGPSNTRIDFNGLNPTDSPFLTFSVWANHLGFAGRPGLSSGAFMFRTAIDGGNQFSGIASDSSGAFILNSGGFNDFWGANPSKTMTHYCFHFDLSTPNFTAYKNGQDVTSGIDFYTNTPKAGNGIMRGDNVRLFGGLDLVEYADMVVSYGELIPAADLYNGGVPPDPGTIAGGPTPLFANCEVIMGGDMTAGDFATGTNIGTGGAGGVVNSDFVDVP